MLQKKKQKNVLFNICISHMQVIEDTYIKIVDISFKAHNMFLEQPSSGMLKSQKIAK